MTRGLRTACSTCIRVVCPSCGWTGYRPRSLTRGYWPPCPRCPARGPDRGPVDVHPVFHRLGHVCVHRRFARGGRAGHMSELKGIRCNRTGCTEHVIWQFERGDSKLTKDHMEQLLRDHGWHAPDKLGRHWCPRHRGSDGRKNRKAGST
jgi:hypothetical protein